MQPTQKSMTGPIVIAILVIAAIVIALIMNSKNMAISRIDTMNSGNPSVQGTTNTPTSSRTPSPTNPANTTTGNPNSGNTTTNLSPSTYYISPAGFSFYYPSKWTLVNGANGQVRFTIGNSMDTLSVDAVSGTSVKSGSVSYTYDSSKGGWIKNTEVLQGNQTVITSSAAKPEFYTVAGSPVFVGGEGKSNIVALSASSFVVVKSNGLKATDSLTKTITGSSQKPNANLMKNTVSTIVDAAK